MSTKAVQPEDWRTLKLNEILTPLQLNEVVNIIGDADNSESIPPLRDYLRSIQSHLDTHQILADYLYYVLLSRLSSNKSSTTAF